MPTEPRETASRTSLAALSRSRSSVKAMLMRDIPSREEEVTRLEVGAADVGADRRARRRGRRRVHRRTSVAAAPATRGARGIQRALDGRRVIADSVAMRSYPWADAYFREQQQVQANYQPGTLYVNADFHAYIHADVYQHADFHSHSNVYADPNSYIYADLHTYRHCHLHTDSNVDIFLHTHAYANQNADAHLHFNLYPHQYSYEYRYADEHAHQY